MEAIPYNRNRFSPGVINSFYPGNSYYESNNILVTTAPSASLAITSISPRPGDDEFIINTLGLTNTYDRCSAWC